MLRWDYKEGFKLSSLSLFWWWFIWKQVFHFNWPQKVIQDQNFFFWICHSVHLKCKKNPPFFVNTHVATQIFPHTWHHTHIHVEQKESLQVGKEGGGELRSSFKTWPSLFEPFGQKKNPVFCVIQGCLPDTQFHENFKFHMKK